VGRAVMKLVVGGRIRCPTHDFEVALDAPTRCASSDPFPLPTGPLDTL